MQHIFNLWVAYRKKSQILTHNYNLFDLEVDFRKKLRTEMDQLGSYVKKILANVFKLFSTCRRAVNTVFARQ